MSITYRIDKRSGVTFAVWDGLITADTLLDHVRRLSSDPDWPPPMRLHLTDLSNARSDSSVDETTIERAAQIYAEHPAKLANMKVAILAHTEFDKARLFESAIARSGVTAIVFNFLDSACAWLGLDTGQVRTALNQLRMQPAAYDEHSSGKPSAQPFQEPPTVPPPP